MTHLKHSGPVRQAAHAKRTALVEIYSDETAANAPVFHECAACVTPTVCERDARCVRSPWPTFAAIEAEANAEARAIVADRAYEAAKSDGSLTRSRDERALKSQIERQGATR
jgi:hypothetical protein